MKSAHHVRSIAGRSHRAVERPRQKPLTLRVAEEFALVTSRRRFLERTLKSAFVVGAGSAMIGTVLNGRVEANHSAPCGPSPICHYSGCNNTYKVCNTANGCRNRHYNQTHCDSHSNCWSVPSPATLCCDCCCPSSRVPLNQPGHQYGPCSGSCSNLRRCICNFSCC